MSSPALLRVPVLAAVVVSTLAAVLAGGALLAPAALADETAPTPPGLVGPAVSSSAPLHAVPVTDSFGRKLR